MGSSVVAVVRNSTLEFGQTVWFVNGEALRPEQVR